MENRKKRRIWVVLVLSHLAPGLGQLYNGEALKAFILYGANALLVVTVRVALGNFYGAVVWALCAIALYFAMLIDALIRCIRQKEIVLTWYTRWHVYLLVIVANFVFNSFALIQPYHAYVNVGASMEPSLRLGDRVIVDTAYYTHHTMTRGDVVVFLFPDEPHTKLLKRVIGLPGETVEVVNSQVVVNGEVLEEPYADQGMKEERLHANDPRQNFGPVVVPADSVFVLGDKRWESFDSRFWKNRYVTTESIIGKALYLYWAKNLTRLGMVVE